MYKILGIVLLCIFITSCNQKKIKTTSNLIENNQNIIIWADNSYITIESSELEWWKKIKEMIYENFDSLTIPVWLTLKNLDWINKFNGDNLTIEVNLDVFWSELLNKIKWAKWKSLHIAVYSDEQDTLIVNDNDYHVYQKLEFDNKEIMLLIWKKIWTVKCWDKVDVTCK